MAFEVKVHSATANYCQYLDGWVQLRLDDSSLVALPVSSILVDQRPATESDFNETTVVVVAPREKPQSGYIKRVKTAVEDPDAQLKWRFGGMRTGTDLFTLLYFGVLEASVLFKNKKLLTAARNTLTELSSSFHFTLNFLEYMERAHKSASLSYISMYLQDSSYIKVFREELSSLPAAYFHSNEAVYRSLHTKEIDTGVWSLHAFASVFNVLLIEVKVENNTLEYGRYYPYSLLPWVIPVYFQTSPPRILYTIEEMHLHQEQGKLAELVLQRNWMSVIREQVELNRVISKSTSLDTLYSLYDYIQAEYSRLLPTFDFSSESHREMRYFPTGTISDIRHTVDLISTYLANEVKSTPPATELLTGLLCCFCQEIRGQHRFPCQCSACQTCICLKLKEKEMIPCPKHNCVVPPELVKPQLPPEVLNAALSSFKTLKCSSCGVRAKRRDFPVKRKATLLIYVLECNDPVCVTCLETAAATKTSQCPVCASLVDLHETQLAAQELVCVQCTQKKTLVTGFHHIRCPEHPLCMQCVSTKRDVTKCTTCKREFKPEEVNVLERIARLKCAECKREVNRTELWPSSGACECTLCQQCGVHLLQRSLNITSCLICGKGKHDPQYVLYTYCCTISSGWMDIPDWTDTVKAMENEKNLRMCLICQSEIVELSTRTTSGSGCPHLFHRFCLGQAFQNDIAKIRGQQLKRGLQCQVPGCPIEVSTTLLTGPFAIIDFETYDAYNEYVSSLDNFEFTCSQCKTQGFIDIKLPHFNCRCGHDQCVKCHGAWTEQHDGRVCEFYVIQKLLELLPKCEACAGKGCEDCTVAQCPGCKYPYLKDPGCDHTACFRPECKVEFCFRCSCLRQPTLEHCNQWHRKQCRHYPKNIPEEQNQKVIADEKLRKDCPMCVRLGRRCDPPKDLVNPRHFTLEEFLSDS